MSILDYFAAVLAGGLTGALAGTAPGFAAGAGGWNSAIGT